MAIMLAIFYILNYVVIKGLYQIHTNFALLEIPVRYSMFWWVFLSSCIMSSAVTFLTEGVKNWDKWKVSIKETERLRNAYKHSRILGLKGQINSHFLFNCFNTLSELITEDEKKAERFLEEMTNVHRYLLKSNTEYLASVEEEMQFVASYLYLTKVRFGNAIDIQLGELIKSSNYLIPPLSLHVILENIIYTNAIDKRNPLLIQIESSDTSLHITNSRHLRTILPNFDVNEGLDNLISKYRLLNAPPITIEETIEKRVINLPMLKTKLAVA
jgi:two-component system LytT family sensor kinase